MSKSSIAKHILQHIMEDDEDNGPADKTFPAKPEWVKKFADLEKQAEEVSRLKSKMTSQSEGNWAKIKEELDLYGYDLVHVPVLHRVLKLHYNSETKEIEARN